MQEHPLDGANLVGKQLTLHGWLAPMLTMEYPTVGQGKLVLCDFASAGMDGGPYRSWLKVVNVPEVP